MKLLGMGPFWDDLSVGDRFRTAGRTLTETDLVNFVNLSWLTEELFTNTEDREHMAISGRVVPAALVYSCAEGLLLPMIQGTGLAFLNATLDVKGPTFVGDTIHVECKVSEVRATSKGRRGLVRTENRVVNQKDETVLAYNPLRMMKGRDS
ncbi:MAG: MaoC family dehydratase N-terminal domain-containing protein [Burkholderiales bacterium]|nr:MaoC family dehydratase N-terminal domain-containing protein [Burkholderiales bacterium]